MTYPDFLTTLTAAAPPATLPPPLRALWHDHRNQWSAAHNIAQTNETATLYCWLHAYLHRREGDTGNAGYWYRRAGRPNFTGSLQQEWEALARAATEI
ncbi:hypothetical protein [Hymenobacter koreensis]|uniref:DUF4034 domain-containing protein n=1 Tax=Hymenobacter koreensis TaxID=1084523 RepID=A0ABP8IVY0_9BACT